MKILPRLSPGGKANANSRALLSAPAFTASRAARLRRGACGRGSQLERARVAARRVVSARGRGWWRSGRIPGARGARLGRGRRRFSHRLLRSAFRLGRGDVARMGGATRAFASAPVARAASGASAKRRGTGRRANAKPRARYDAPPRAARRPPRASYPSQGRTRQTVDASSPTPPTNRSGTPSPPR